MEDDPVTQVVGVDDRPEARGGADDPPAADAEPVGWRKAAARPSRLVGHLAAFAWFGLVAVYATWPLAAHAGTAVLGNLGDPLEIAWRFAWAAHAVVHQPLQLFDANMFHPEPLTLAYSEHHLGVSLPVAPVFWVTGNALLAYNVEILLVLAAGGFGVYLLTADVTGSRLAALVAGTAYTAVPFRISMASLGHVHALALHLAPLVLVVLRRLHRGRSWRPVVGLAVLVGAALWSSFTAGFMTLIAVVIFAVWEVGRLRRRVWPWLWRAGAGTAAGLVAALPVLWPYVEVRRDHPNYRHSPSEVIALSATAGAYLHPPPGGPVVRPVYTDLADRFRPAYAPGEKELFPGLWLLGAAVATAVGGAFAAGRRRLSGRRRQPAQEGSGTKERRWSAVGEPDGDGEAERGGGRPPAGGLAGFFGLLTVVAVVLSFGPRYGARPDGLPMPFALADSLTAGSLQRAPVRIGALALLGLALLAGIGLARLRPPVRRVVAAASLVALAVEFMPVQVALAEPPPRTAAHAAIAARDGAVLGLPTIEWDAQGKLLHTSVIRESQHLYLSTAHWRPMTNGWGAYAPPGAFTFARAVADIPSPGAFQALRERGVRTVVVQTNLTGGTTWDGVERRLAAWPGVRLVGQGDGVLVYDVSGAAP